jgi:hypothetical protein
MAGDQNNVATVTASVQVKAGHAVLKAVYFTGAGTTSDWEFRNGGAGGEILFTVDPTAENDLPLINRRFDAGLYITVPSGGTPECVVVYE